MNIRIFREYRLKFYLNARHYIIIGNNKSDVHPHTWEYALTIRINRNEFVKFTVFEREINKYLDRYQDIIVNDLEPFNTIMPTLENMVDYFAKEFYGMIDKVGGELVCVEGSEGPSRSYILNLREGSESMNVMDEQTDDILSEIIDSILDDIVE